MGQIPATQTFIRTLLQTTRLPVVVDADGLNALADDPGFITRHAEGRWILTPHAGEFMRLADDDVDLTDRIRTAQTYAQRWNCVLILKGMPSLTAAPDGTVYINPTGNPALATAGTGDVLAGMCTGLLTQGLSPLHAAVCALHLGGAAADRYALHCHAPTMMATDLLDHLPLILRERFA
jgi:NAD(P)H-hydrate epimerase